MDLDDLQRTFFDSLYAFRTPVAVGTVILAVGVLVAAWRLGWFAAARRHPARAGVLLVVLLAIGLPAAWYVASPLWIRTELVEPDPVALDDPTSSPVPATSPGPTTVASDPRPAVPVATATATPPRPTPFVARRILRGSFSGTDDFHFGRGTATIVETGPGAYTLRLEEFSVRNGPDLFVYLSPKANDHADGALELGRLKATDGAFGYELPPGTDPADFASAIIWCKQFSHLFAFAPLAAV